MQYPERHSNHTLEQKSETFFMQHLPQDWIATTPKKDYGQDLNLEICEEGQYRSLDLIVQLKSSATSNILNNRERHQLKVSTYNYLWDNLRVVLIVKYIEDENEAYWTLLKDVEPPANPEQENFMIYFPRQNKLSEINWSDIINYVRQVTDKKLASTRAKNKQNHS
ncbi:MAG: DUF4365 domain-containing protein [Ignavibacterium sp.]|nr:DUF4365 domain-containing protein [Candidatus Kuenenia stuttgartiensis]MCZ7611803.1 DUF4365 domain-containing protein [Ignavibacterium sp.]